MKYVLIKLKGDDRYQTSIIPMSNFNSHPFGAEYRIFKTWKKAYKFLKKEQLREFKEHNTVLRKLWQREGSLQQLEYNKYRTYLRKGTELTIVAEPWSIKDTEQHKRMFNATNVDEMTFHCEGTVKITFKDGYEYRSESGDYISFNNQNELTIYRQKTFLINFIKVCQ